MEIQDQGPTPDCAEECKRRAADCMREAGCANDDMLRQAYFQLARHWNKMADNANLSKYVEIRAVKLRR
jgi:hypothetical protein